MVDLHRKKILVVGDIVLDRYVIGHVERISPEAPIPILRPNRIEERPGMAGNVALNLASLGQEVHLLSRIGQDEASAKLQKLLTDEGIHCHFKIDSSIPTPVKTRMVASNQQLLRIDEETITPYTTPIIDLPLQEIDLIAISDYKKGFLSTPLLRTLIDSGIPTIVDPKGRDFIPYRGATLIKPNFHEAREASGLEALDEIAQKLLIETRAKALLITRSEQGLSLFTPHRTDIPAHVHDVRDVTGAGDTVLAILAAAIANNRPFQKAAELANYGASLAVQQFGCAQVDLQNLEEYAKL